MRSIVRPVLAILGFAGLALAVVVAVLGAVHGSALRHVTFVSPLWFVAAVLPVLAIVVRTWWSPRAPTLRFSRVASIRRMRTGYAGWVGRLAHLPDGLRVAAGLLLVVALARPQSTRGSDRIRHEGIDIVLVLDLSDSMETPDMAPNRLGAAKLVVDDFIKRRPHDRIGVVAFGSTASTIAPLTMDHGVLRALVKRLRLGVMDGSTTAIGAGLGVALNRLEEAAEDTEPGSQIVVLLTDGVHNAEGLDPDSAAEAALRRSVRIYTVLMGQHNVRDGSVDPARLERIASMTGGYAYTAADQDALRGSFQDLLDRLERTDKEGEAVRPELFGWLLWPALVLLGLDIGLRTTRLRRFP